MIMDRVEAGKREVTIDTEGYTKGQIDRILAAAKERGLSAFYDGRSVLIQDRRTMGEARRSKKTFETYASDVERALIASGVRPGQADVWISNHGSLIDQEFKSGTSSAETAERILEHERGATIPFVDEARRRVRAPEPVDDPFYIIQGVYNGSGAYLSGEFGFDEEDVALAEAKKLLRSSHFQGDYVRVITRDGELVWDSRGDVQEMREATRRIVHVAPASGWTAGKRPSHAEIWADGKPITVAKSGRKWIVTVMGRPVVNGSSGGLTFEGRAGYVDGLAPARFDSKGDADSVAHKIGRYMLNLGDFVHTYVEYV